MRGLSVRWTAPAHKALPNYLCPPVDGRAEIVGQGLSGGRGLSRRTGTQPAAGFALASTPASRRCCTEIGAGAPVSGS